MSHIDILLPFSLPPAEMAPDLLRALKMPALASLLSCGKQAKLQDFDAFSRALPHEIWLARQFGLDNSQTGNKSPQVATALMQSFGLATEAGHWFVLQPVHIHIARDHLVLTDQRRLDLSEQESHALFETAKPLFEEAGKSLLYGDVHTWFVRADDWADLLTATPDAACGHNIDIWMPKDPHDTHDRAWRKLQNEVQMHWHTHVINEQREFRRADPINSVWLWAGASSAQLNAQTTYTHAFNLSGSQRAFGQFASNQMQQCTAADVIATASERGLLMLDALTGSGLAQDWSYWLEQMHALEDNWFAPILAALRDGTVSSVSLILTHNTKLTEFNITRNSLRKFWVKPSLAPLQT
ncbi:MAG: hypothetical protein ACXWJD_05070 [Burkholderiaceae bacterium]